MLATTSGGMAKMIMNAVTSMAHTKSGIRLSDMPGARCRKTVTMSSTAATSAATSRNVISVTQ
jgi:hypothetical protein